MAAADGDDNAHGAKRQSRSENQEGQAATISSLLPSTTEKNPLQGAPRRISILLSMFTPSEVETMMSQKLKEPCAEQECFAKRI
eukprot:2328021-Amphidinium_carterae.1